MSNLRFKVGDRVKVVDRQYGHEFEIGEEVEITDSTQYYYMAQSIDSKRYWYLMGEELAPIESFEETPKLMTTEKKVNELAIAMGYVIDGIMIRDWDEITNHDDPVKKAVGILEKVRTQPQSFEEKTAKAFEEIATGTGPEMVVISAEEYANFQKMENLMGGFMLIASNDHTAVSFYQSEIEKLLKQKYNP